MIGDLQQNEIFVFGSNSKGLHGGGAARYAFLHFGAVWGEGRGLHGRTYAIDTMSGLDAMRDEVREFVGFASAHPSLRFLVTEIGCGIAGYTPADVAPFFGDAPDNVVLPGSFAQVIRDGKPDQ